MHRRKKKKNWLLCVADVLGSLGGRLLLHCIEGYKLDSLLNDLNLVSSSQHLHKV